MSALRQASRRLAAQLLRGSAAGKLDGKQQRLIATSIATLHAAEPAPAPVALSKLRDSFADGTSAAYIEDLEARYKADPRSVDATWAMFFRALGTHKAAAKRAHLSFVTGLRVGVAEELTAWSFDRVSYLLHVRASADVLAVDPAAGWVTGGLPTKTNGCPGAGRSRVHPFCHMYVYVYVTVGVPRLTRHHPAALRISHCAMPAPAPAAAARCERPWQCSFLTPCFVRLCFMQRAALRATASPRHMTPSALVS